VAAGIDPISGFITPDEKHLPGRDGILVELSAWPSFYDAGELRHLLAAGEALPWRGQLGALGGCSSSGCLPWLPLCLGRTVLPLATNGSIECVMGMGLSPN